MHERLIRLSNNFWGCPLGLKIESISPRLFVHEGTDFNSSIAFQFGAALSSPSRDRFACALVYESAGTAEIYPFDEEAQACPIRVQRSYGRISKLAIVVGRNEQVLLEVDSTHPELPALVFEPLKAAALRENVRLLPHSLPNTLPYKFEPPEEAVNPLRRMAEEHDLRLLAQLRDPAIDAARQGSIEIVWRLADILATPGFEFQLEEVMVVDPRQRNLELSFFLDFADAAFSTSSGGRYLRVGHGTKPRRFPVLPWLPALAPASTGELVAVRVDRDLIRLNLTFGVALPLRDLSIDSLYLGSPLWRASSLSVMDEYTIGATFTGFDADLSREDWLWEVFVDVTFVGEAEQRRGVQSSNSLALRLPGVKVVIVDQLVIDKLQFAPRSHVAGELTDREAFDVVLGLSEMAEGKESGTASTLGRLREVLLLDGHTLRLAYAFGSPGDPLLPSVDSAPLENGTCKFPPTSPTKIVCEGLSLPLAPSRAGAALPELWLSILADGQPILALGAESHPIYRVQALQATGVAEEATVLALSPGSRPDGPHSLQVEI